MDRRKTKKIDYEAMQSLFQQNESTAHVASSGENWEYDVVGHLVIFFKIILNQR